MSASRKGPLPLVVTGDSDLIDDLVRLAAAAGTEIDLAPDPAAARPRYPFAPVVIVGTDRVSGCLLAGMPRRSRVVVAGYSSGMTEREEAWDRAKELGAEHLALLPEAEPWLFKSLVQSVQPPVLGLSIAVLGGRGGAGASTLAGGLAMTAVQRGLRTLLLDADPLGGGLDLVLGWEKFDGLRWAALAEAGGHIEGPALFGALPRLGDLVLLSFARDELLVVPSSTMEQTLAAARNQRDLTVIDVPRRLDDAAVLALEAADRALIVVPAEVRAVAAASRVAATARLHCKDLQAVVRGPAPGRLKPSTVARALELPLAGTLRPEQALLQGLEHGEAPAQSGKGPLAELCRALLATWLDPHNGEAAA
ncbi:septum site-determining protein Ssd [Actinoplanes sp. TFC3]|uniref:septum site-determining protein Ssd n=1 Tax=Actinoplanes sp. TFC3 TaxID=1710355 RepID=UPI0008352293|nr:septum site-determining protein Ssd [Actinoplanes sp. TFC3]